jgi:cytochrome b involved in lipid metabolism
MSKTKIIVKFAILNFLLIIVMTAILSVTENYKVNQAYANNQDLYQVDSQPQVSDPVSIQTIAPSSVAIQTTASKPTAVSPTKTPVKPTPKPVASRCIITIQGVKYDVTNFRNIHSGGNIFQCGADMTSTFFGQHNSSTLAAMAKYRV